MLFSFVYMHCILPLDRVEKREVREDVARRPLVICRVERKEFCKFSKDLSFKFVQILRKVFCHLTPLFYKIMSPTTELSSSWKGMASSAHLRISLALRVSA